MLTGETVFKKNGKEPLEADAVIVDEMSMVDLPLMQALLEAVKPGCRLVMVGDPDQLPSVGAGNVLGDMLRSGAIPAVSLTQVFRQAEQSAIIRNAHAVNVGQPPCLDSNQGDFFFLRIMKFVSAHPQRAGSSAGMRPVGVRQPGPIAKGGLGLSQCATARQEAAHGVLLAMCQQRAHKVHVAPAFARYGHALCGKGMQGCAHLRVGGNALGVQFWVAAGKVQASATVGRRGIPQG